MAAIADIELRLAALEQRVFGYVPGAYDVIAMRSGKDVPFIQSSVVVIGSAAESGGAEAAAKVLRLLLPHRIITQNELGKIVILAELAIGQEIALCEFSDAHGLVWREMD